MDSNETNAHSCPLYQQTGADAVVAFDALIAALPPALRTAFEAERTARQQEIEAIICEYGYRT